jgi:ApbE superfamily uncharacterized protein (UPF0280 family)
LDCLILTITGMYEPRTYRNTHTGPDIDSFTVTWRETDLWIGVDKGSVNDLMRNFVLERIVDLRSVLDDYNLTHKDFFTSHIPLSYDNDAPLPVKKMLSAASKSDTGPMSSVAGLFAAHIGDSLREEFQLDNIIIENGGDNYFLLNDIDGDMPIFAGDSSISGKIGIRIRGGDTPVGVCTSSGRFGHSFSYGRAHSVTVVSRDIVLADAYATKLCNMIRSDRDLKNALEEARSAPGILGCVIIIDEHVGIIGDCEIIHIQAPA